MNKTKNTLPVASIFHSFDGEVNYSGQGTPSTFIRFAGCNLRCWGGQCDTTHALEVTKATQFLDEDQIIKEVEKQGNHKVTITGGEPLLYCKVLAFEKLIRKLCFLDKSITVETNGSILPPVVNSKVSWIADFKCPSTGETEKMVPFEKMYSHLSDKDYIKFVIADEEDYEFSKNKVLSVKSFVFGPRLAFSPMIGKVDPSWLADKMIWDKLVDVQFNLQIHKYIWPNPGREV